MTEDTPTAGKARIIVVDDEDALRFVLTVALREKYNITAFSNGTAALEDVRQTPCDAALVDLQMPGMSGIELLKEFNKLPATLRPEKIIVSGKLTSELLEQCNALGVIDTIRKPFRLAVVEKAIERAIAVRRRRLESTQ